MLICRRFQTRLAAATIWCLIGLASSAMAGGCGHHASAGYGSWRLQARVHTYVENPQVFRSELRPRLSYAIKFYCVWVAQPRRQGQALRGARARSGR